jgi:hypothetical protein
MNKSIITVRTNLENTSCFLYVTIRHINLTKCMTVKASILHISLSNALESEKDIK